MSSRSSYSFKPLLRLWLAISLVPLIYRLLMVWFQQESQGVSLFGRQFAVGLASDFYLSTVFTILFLINPRIAHPMFKNVWRWFISFFYLIYCLLLTANAVTVYFRHTNLAAGELSLIFDLSDLLDSVRSELSLPRILLLIGVGSLLTLVITEILKVEKILERGDAVLKARNGSKWKTIRLAVTGLILISLALRSGSLAQRVILHEPLETNPLTFLHWRWSVRQNFFKTLQASTFDQKSLTEFLRRESRTPLAIAKSHEISSDGNLSVTILDQKQGEAFPAPFWRNHRKAESLDIPKTRQEFPTKDGQINNVVLILLESMSRTYSLDHPEITPQLNQWGSLNAVEFQRHFATAYRTCAAQFSMLCSLYDPPEYYVSRDFPDSRFRCLPEILKDHGFKPYWITGADAQFDYNGHFLTRNGFTQTITRTDLPEITTGSSYGADDSYAYEKAIETLDSRPSQTFIYLMTTSNHHPYVVPETFLAQHPEIRDWEPIRRSYFYADYQLGEFLRKAESRPWFKNTLFVMAGDHAHWGYDGPGMTDAVLNHQNLRHRFNTKMLLRIPGVEPKIIDGWDTTHIDIAPTILDLLRIDSVNDGLGRSMLNPPTSERWIASQDNTRNSVFSIHRADLALIRDAEANSCRALSPQGGSETCNNLQKKEIETFEHIFFTPIHMYLRDQNR